MLFFIIITFNFGYNPSLNANNYLAIHLVQGLTLVKFLKQVLVLPKEHKGFGILVAKVNFHII